MLVAGQILQMGGELIAAVIVGAGRTCRAKEVRRVGRGGPGQVALKAGIEGKKRE